MPIPFKAKHITATTILVLALSIVLNLGLITLMDLSEDESDPKEATTTSLLENTIPQTTLEKETTTSKEVTTTKKITTTMPPTTTRRSTTTRPPTTTRKPTTTLPQTTTTITTTSTLPPLQCDKFRELKNIDYLGTLYSQCCLTNQTLCLPHGFYHMPYCREECLKDTTTTTVKPTTTTTFPQTCEDTGCNSGEKCCDLITISGPVFKCTPEEQSCCTPDQACRPDQKCCRLGGIPTGCCAGNEECCGTQCCKNGENCQTTNFKGTQFECCPIGESLCRPVGEMTLPFCSFNCPTTTSTTTTTTSTTTTSNPNTCGERICEENRKCCAPTVNGVTYNFCCPTTHQCCVDPIRGTTYCASECRVL